MEYVWYMQLLVICVLTWNRNVAIDPPADLPNPKDGAMVGAGGDPLPNNANGEHMQETSDHETLDDVMGAVGGADGVGEEAGDSVEPTQPHQKSEQVANTESEEELAGQGSHIQDVDVRLKEVKDKAKQDDIDIRTKNQASVSSLQQGSDINPNTESFPADLDLPLDDEGGEGDGHPITMGGSEADKSQHVAAGGDGMRQDIHKPAERHGRLTDLEAENPDDIRLEKNIKIQTGDKTEDAAQGSDQTTVSNTTTSIQTIPIIFTVAESVGAGYRLTSNIHGSGTRSQTLQFIINTIVQINHLTEEMGLMQLGSDEPENIFRQASAEHVEERLGNTFNFCRNSTFSHVVYHNNEYTLIRVRLSATATRDLRINQAIGNRPLIIEVQGVMPFQVHFDPSTRQMYLVFHAAFTDINADFLQRFIEKDYFPIIAQMLNYYLDEASGSSVPVDQTFVIFIIAILFTMSEMIYSGIFADIIRNFVCHHNLDSSERKSAIYKTRPTAVSQTGEDTVQAVNGCSEEMNRRSRMILLKDLVKNIFQTGFNFEMFMQNKDYPENPGSTSQTIKPFPGQSGRSARASNTKMEKFKSKMGDNTPRSRHASDPTRQEQGIINTVVSSPQPGQDVNQTISSEGAEAAVTHRYGPVEPELDRSEEVELTSGGRVSDKSRGGARPKTKSLAQTKEEKK